MVDIFFVIVEQFLLHLPLVMGAFISFSLLKVPDLSLESAYVIGAICGSQCMLLLSAHYYPLWLVVPIALGASVFGGAVVGVVSSVLTQKGGFPHLLSSIITFGLFHGIAQLLAPAYLSLGLVANPLTVFVLIKHHPELVALLFVGSIVVIGCALLFRTQIGYAYRVYGNNPFFFKNYRISTAFIFITGVIIANALAGLSGYLFAQSNTFVELNMGLGKALLCITALILGKELVGTSNRSVVMPVAGAFIYFTVQQLLLKGGFDLKYFTCIQACLVLVLLLYSYKKRSANVFSDNLGV